MRVTEVVPGLLIGTRLVPPAAYESLGVDAIIDLEDWDVAWNPSVPTGCLYVSFPIEDGARVDPGVREVAAFTASLVRADRQVLVHCTEGLNRSGVVVARALLELGWTAPDAIARVRAQRGLTEDGFEALSNDAFVDWLLTEEERAAPAG
jgi:protein-tyrosine phosphatase